MAHPVRVLHVCAGNLYGGIERIVAQCAVSRALAPTMAPRFAVCFEGRLAAELDAAGAACARLGPARLRAPWTIARARRRLAREMADAGIDVVVGHSAWALALAGPPARRHGARLAFWLHDRVSGRTIVERWACRSRPDAVVANSDFTRASVRHMFASVPTSVVYAPVPPVPPLPPAARLALRDDLGAGATTPVVLMASRFERCKGHEVLLAALAGIPEPWCLWIAGGAQRPAEAAYERDLRQRVAALGLAPRVRFLGERADVPALMRAADIHCQPNTGEDAFGLAFVEALYAGLPVVTSDLGGPREIVTPECGVLVPPGDVAALRAALARLLLEPARRRGLGAHGPARAAALCDPSRQLGALAAVLAAPVPVPA